MSDILLSTEMYEYFWFDVNAQSTESLTWLKDFWCQLATINDNTFAQMQFYINNSNYTIYNDIVLMLLRHKVSLDVVTVWSNSFNFQEGQQLVYTQVHPLVFNSRPPNIIKELVVSWLDFIDFDSTICDSRVLSLNTIDFNVSKLASRLGSGKQMLDSVTRLKAVVCQQPRSFVVVKHNIEESLIVAPNVDSIEICDSKLMYSQFYQFMNLLGSTLRRKISNFKCSWFCPPNSMQTLHLVLSDVRIAYYWFDSEQVKFMTAK